MGFGWDSRKASTNLRRHGVAFVDAASVFADPLARIFADPDHSDQEQREPIVGRTTANRLLIVSFVERGDNVRIISARRATAGETHDYERHTKQSRG